MRHEYNVTSSSKKGVSKSPLILSGQALAGLANVRSRSQREQNETATVAKGTNWNRRQWIGSGFGKTMSYNVWKDGHISNMNMSFFSSFTIEKR